MNLESFIEGMLRERQERIDAEVARVRAAADAFVDAFRGHVEALLASPATTVAAAPPEATVAPPQESLRAVIPEPSPAQREIEAVMAAMIAKNHDPEAAAANMGAWKQN